MKAEEEEDASDVFDDSVNVVDVLVENVNVDNCSVLDVWVSEFDVVEVTAAVIDISDVWIEGLIDRLEDEPEGVIVENVTTDEVIVAVDVVDVAVIEEGGIDVLCVSR